MPGCPGRQVAEPESPVPSEGLSGDLTPIQCYHTGSLGRQS
jgi:hypothetical protein